jgi:hypothetical protein
MAPALRMTRFSKRCSAFFSHCDHGLWSWHGEEMAGMLAFPSPREMTQELPSRTRGAANAGLGACEGFGVWAFLSTSVGEALRCDLMLSSGSGESSFRLRPRLGSPPNVLRLLVRPVSCETRVQRCHLWPSSNEAVATPPAKSSGVPLHFRTRQKSRIPCPNADSYTGPEGRRSPSTRTDAGPLSPGCKDVGDAFSRISFARMQRNPVPEWQRQCL